MFGYSSVGSLKDDSFVVETFLYDICAGIDHGMKANSTSYFSLISFKYSFRSLALSLRTDFDTSSDIYIWDSKKTLSLRALAAAFRIFTLSVYLRR